jgi:hypothetical protein
MSKTMFLQVMTLWLCQMALCQPFGQTMLGYEQGDGAAVNKTNVYSKLSNQELTEKTKAFVQALRSLNDDFKKAINPIAPGDRAVNSKARPMEDIQREYDRKFAAQAQDLERELMNRLPDGSKPKDVPSEIASMLIKNGRLAGANPADMIASYLESLLTHLPHVSPAPRK